MTIRHSIAAGLAAALLTIAVPAIAQEPLDLDGAIAVMGTDPAAAYAAFRRLSDAGDAEAKNGLAALLEHGFEGQPADPQRAMVLMQEAAAAGSDAARMNLGMRQLMNEVPGDDAEAVAMLNQITNEDLQEIVSWQLGRAYLFGQGVEQDLARGTRLMAVAVEADPENADARFLLGRAYQNGWGVTPDQQAAFEHLKVAADAGDERAQWQVGMMLLNGEGVGRNPTQARRYVTASAEGGHVPGMISMAVMYALGEGGAVDATKSRDWYRRAAEAGSAHALRGLGGMLMVGEGGAVDEVTAAAYLDLAAKAGDAQAAQMRQAFADRIARLNRADVEAVKTRWLREHGSPR